MRPQCGCECADARPEPARASRSCPCRLPTRARRQSPPDGCRRHPPRSQHGRRAARRSTASVLPASRSVERLADAQNRHQPSLQRCRKLGGHFASLVSPYSARRSEWPTMTASQPDIPEHSCGHFAGVGALAVFGHRSAHPAQHPTPLTPPQRSADTETADRRAPPRLSAKGLSDDAPASNHGLHERRIGGSAAVHFPVSGNQQVLRIRPASR